MEQEKEYVVRLGELWVSDSDYRAQKIKLSEFKYHKEITSNLNHVQKVAEKIGGKVYELKYEEVEDDTNDDLLTLMYHAGQGRRDEIKEHDSITSPSHYQGVNGLEVREVQENFVPYFIEWGALVASDIKDAIKYILRAPNKNGLEDLKKARQMLDYAIERIENKGAIK